MSHSSTHGTRTRSATRNPTRTLHSRHFSSLCTARLSPPPALVCPSPLCRHASFSSRHDGWCQTHFSLSVVISSSVWSWHAGSGRAPAALHGTLATRTLLRSPARRLRGKWLLCYFGYGYCTAGPPVILDWSKCLSQTVLSKRLDRVRCSGYFSFLLVTDSSVFGVKLGRKVHDDTFGRRILDPFASCRFRQRIELKGQSREAFLVNFRIFLRKNGPGMSRLLFGLLPTREELFLVSCTPRHARFDSTCSRHII